MFRASILTDVSSCAPSQTLAFPAIARATTDGAAVSQLRKMTQRPQIHQNPSEDLSGRDAERKLRILAEVAFGEPLLSVTTDPLSADVATAACEASRRGLCLRQVSRVCRRHDGCIGQVSFESMESDHPLAIATGEWNSLLLTQNDGRSVRVVGRGAGRWPTTEAVIADLLEAHRENGAPLGLHPLESRRIVGRGMQE